MQPFGHNRNGPQLGRGLCPLLGEGRVGSTANTKSPGLRPSSIPSGILIHAAIWPQQIWDENWVGVGSPSNIMWPGWGLPACQVSSWFVQPYGHSARTLQTDRQTDRQQTGQHSDSIGQTVLQTVAQKYYNKLKQLKKPRFGRLLRPLAW